MLLHKFVASISCSKFQTKWRFQRYNRTGSKTTKTEMKAFLFAETSLKQTEGKLGVKMRDILIDLTWKPRSKGFGDQESHTKKGELTEFNVKFSPLCLTKVASNLSFCELYS